MAEVAVHLTLATLPDDYMLATILVPDRLSFEEISPANLPKSWNAFPHLDATRKIGVEFVRENRNCLLKVPSAVTKGDFNFLINPNHKDFPKIKLRETEKFPFDKRIFR